jgi:hypothetical protein
MKFYWSIAQTPELAGLSPEQVKQASQFCYKKYAFKHWETWASLVFLGLLFGVLTSSSRGLSPIIGGAIAGGIGGGIFSLTTINVLRPHLRDYVSTHFPSSTESSFEE